MTCTESKPRLHAYIDGELDSSGSLALEKHLDGCASCTRDLDNLRVLAKSIENGALRYKASPRLRRNVQAAIRTANPQKRMGFFQWRWVALAASLVLIVAITWNGGIHWSSSSETQLVDDIVANHVRSMMANHITDVASSDSHTVKPWFGGKLDYSPPAKDLTEQGFRLVGGRLDYLSGQPVAAIVYQRSQHYINLFVWPSNRTPTRPEDHLA
ncbi:MAG TPA: anti-sigma factor, partial [Terriglobia bacterium]|nr:anti-sigma factor [Terriglobia bacterium]